MGIGSRFGLVCVVSLAVASSLGCGSSKPDAKAATGEGGGNNNGPAEVGKAAPDLSMSTVNGKGSVSMESLKGKVAVIDFWATWCGPCKQSFPKLEELAKKYSGKVEIIGVSVDDSKDGVAEFAKEHGATFAIGWDDGHAIANRWKVGTMPTTYVVDSTGTVRYIHDGYHDGEADKIGKELAELSDEPGGGGSTSKVASGDGDKPAGGDGDKPASGGDTAGGDPPADPPPAPPTGKKPGGKTKPGGGKKPGGGGKKPGGKKK